MSISCICKQCGKEFSVPSSDMRRGRGTFCSRQCSGLFKSVPVEDRFWIKVQKTETCWLWTGYTMPFGHGQMSTPEGPKLTHRVSWEIHFGAIPDGYDVCHHCDVPNCVNPTHLFLGTQADNMADMHKKGRESHKGAGESTPRGTEHHNARITEEQVVEILNLRNQGLSYRKIAERFDFFPQSIGEICRGETWKHVQRPEITFTDAVRKLTEPQVTEIINRLANGESQAKLAIEFGVSRSNIHHIAAGDSWNHLPRPWLAN